MRKIPKALRISVKLIDPVDMEQLCEDRRQCHTSTEGTCPGGGVHGKVREFPDFGSITLCNYGACRDFRMSSEQHILPSQKISPTEDHSHNEGNQRGMKLHLVQVQKICGDVYS